MKLSNAAVHHEQMLATNSLDRVIKVASHKLEACPVCTSRMPKLVVQSRRNCILKNFSLMFRFITSGLIAAGTCVVLLRAFDCHILPATDYSESSDAHDRATMQPFSKIMHCAPFNVMIEPGTGYKVSITADDSVKAGVSAAVHDETLHLEVTKGFETANPIKVVVSLPHDKLQSVYNKAPQSDIAVAQGFRVHSFNAHNAGSANLYLEGLDAENASLENSG